MSRSDIFQVVTSFMFEIVDELNPAVEIHEQDRFADLGADSIDVVEIVSDSMRALNVKIDRTKLDSAQNIGGLLDLLEQAVAETHGTVSHSAAGAE